MNFCFRIFFSVVWKANPVTRPTRIFFFAFFLLGWSGIRIRSRTRRLLWSVQVCVRNSSNIISKSLVVASFFLLFNAVVFDFRCKIQDSSSGRFFFFRSVFGFESSRINPVVKKRKFPSRRGYFWTVCEDPRVRCVFRGVNFCQKDFLASCERGIYFYTEKILFLRFSSFESKITLA